MRTQPIYLSAAMLSVLTTAHAQMSTASQQADALRIRQQLEESARYATDTTNVPALYETEADDVGPQTVVQMKPRRTWVQAFADAQYFYTDNMFLSDHTKQGADVLVSTVQAAIAPTPFDFADGRLAPRLGYEHQWFNYGLASSDTVTVEDFNTLAIKNDSLDVFNFNSSTVFGDVSWGRENWLFTVGTDFRQLLDSSSYDSFYRELVPSWSVRRDFRLSDTTGISLSYEGDYRCTETAPPEPTGYGFRFNDRTDNSLVIVGSWRLCSHLMIQPFYRFQYTHYTRIDRDDFLHSFGLTAYCPLTKNVTLRGFVGYDDMNTDGLYAQNYEALSAGGGLTLSVQF